jgi:hypothetical protein
VESEVLSRHLGHSPGIAGNFIMEFDVLSRRVKHSPGLLDTVPAFESLS